MKKMKLSVDALRVESFAVASQSAEREGTVHAHARTDRYTCPATCEATCQTQVCPCPFSIDVTRCVC